MLVEHLLHDGGEDSLGDSGAHLNIVLAILEDLWLDDWHESILLADRSVSGEGVSGLSDGSLGWATSWGDLKNSSPFCESASQLIVFSTSLAKSIESLGGGLSVSSADGHEAGVDLDAAVDSSASQDLGELLGAVGGGVSDGLIEHDDSADVLLDAWGREEELTVSLSVGVVVLDADAVESLADGAGGLVGGEDTLAWGADLLRGLDELGLEVTGSVLFALHTDLLFSLIIIGSRRFSLLNCDQTTRYGKCRYLCEIMVVFG